MKHERAKIRELREKNRLISQGPNVSLKLHLSYIFEGGTMDHSIDNIIQALLNEGGFTHVKIANKLVYFGALGVNTF